MNWHPDMFISKWHLIALAMIVIAWISLWLGGYDRKTILKSGLGATVMLYIIATLPIALLVQDREVVAEQMATLLNQQHEARITSDYGQVEGERNQLEVAVSSRKDDDGYVTYIFAGNYSESSSFHGSLDVLIYDAEGQTLHEERYEDITLKSGDKLKIDQFYSTRSTGKYQYRFNSQPVEKVP